jgi:hypothetical protein
VCWDTQSARGFLRTPFLGDEQHQGLAFKSQFSHPPDGRLLGYVAESEVAYVQLARNVRVGSKADMVLRRDRRLLCL